MTAIILNPTHLTPRARGAIGYIDSAHMADALNVYLEGWSDQFPEGHQPTTQEWAQMLGEKEGTSYEVIEPAKLAELGLISFNRSVIKAAVDVRLVDEVALAIYDAYDSDDIARALQDSGLAIVPDAWDETKPLAEVLDLFKDHTNMGLELEFAREQAAKLGR